MGSRKKMLNQIKVQMNSIENNVKEGSFGTERSISKDEGPFNVLEGEINEYLKNVFPQVGREKAQAEAREYRLACVNGDADKALDSIENALKLNDKKLAELMFRFFKDLHGKEAERVRKKIEADLS